MLNVRPEFNALLQSLFNSKGKSSSEISYILLKKHKYDSYKLINFIEEIKTLMELSFNLDFNNDGLWKLEFYRDVFQNIDRETIFAHLSKYVNILLTSPLIDPTFNLRAGFYEDIFLGLKDVLPAYYQNKKVEVFNNYIQIIIDFFEFIKYVNFSSEDQQAGFEITNQEDPFLLEQVMAKPDFYLEKVDAFKDILFSITKDSKHYVAKKYQEERFVKGERIYLELFEIIEGLKSIKFTGEACK